MKIIISNLSDGKHNYDFCEMPDFFDLHDYKTEGGITVNVELLKYGGQMQAKIFFRGDFFFDCDRCTKNIKLEISNTFEVIYKYSKRPEEVDLKDENLFFITPETNHINLKDIVREYILLSIPMRKVPPEQNGICLECKLNIDEILESEKKNEINPVWEKLLNK
jgi:uncharacterized protein